jgi:hypothetical protein
MGLWTVLPRLGVLSIVQGWIFDRWRIFDQIAIVIGRYRIAYYPVQDFRTGFRKHDRTIFCSTRTVVRVASV